MPRSTEQSKYGSFPLMFPTYTFRISADLKKWYYLFNFREYEFNVDKDNINFTILMYKVIQNVQYRNLDRF